MPRTITAQRAETWLYLHDEKDELCVLEDKAPPDDGGTYIKVGPTPQEVLNEAGLAFVGSEKKLKVDAPARVLVKMVETSVLGWVRLKIEGEDEYVAWTKPEDVELLPPFIKGLLQAWLQDRAIEGRQGKERSATSPEKTRSSGQDTRDRRTA